MTSEKWFDWDTSDTPETERSASEPSTETPDLPAEEPRLETDSTANPTPGDFEPFEALPSSALAEDSAGSNSDPILPVATDEQNEPRTSTAVRALHLEPEPKTSLETVRPFHLWITGKLRTFEKERLMELLARENFGIREVDLEIQLEAEKILLPRISEYAAVLVAQALRGASITLRLEPSEVAAEASANPAPGSFSQPASPDRTPERHPAEELPITHESSISGHQEFDPIDVLIATGLIREPEWKAETSDSYTDMIESLKRELRFKAYLKKADALIQFQTKILSNPWISTSECRVQVTALAIRYRS